MLALGRKKQNASTAKCSDDGGSRTLYLSGASLLASIRITSMICRICSVSVWPFPGAPLSCSASSACDKHTPLTAATLINQKKAIPSVFTSSLRNKEKICAAKE